MDHAAEEGMVRKVFSHTRNEKGVKMHCHLLCTSVVETTCRAIQIAVAVFGIAVASASPCSTAYAQVHNALAGDALFPSAQNVLAEFNFTNNVLDSSGNQRNAELLGGTFIETSCGAGLVVGQGKKNGLDWSQHAKLLVHPYTIEIILTPQQTTEWSKIFGFDNREDNGWYYKNQGIQAYPNSVLGTGTVLANERHYLAFASTSPSTIAVYFQGNPLGTTDATFSAPPDHAIFFRDDTEVAGEDLRATIDALRISSISRTPEEIREVQKKIERCSVVNP